MKNYKLLIQNSAGDWITACLGDDKPAINYQSNNLAELKDRQSNYSQQLKLPITPENCMIFGSVHTFDAINTSLYKKFNCRLYCNDFTLAGVGSYIIVTRVADFIYTQILSGNSNLFELLNAPMSDIDLGHIIRNQDACNPVNFDDKYVFAAATFIKGGAPIFQSALQHNFPFVNFKKAIETLLSDKGYSLNTNLTDEQWNDWYLSLCSVKSNFDEYYGKATANIVISDTETIFPLLFDVVNNASGKLYSNLIYNAPFESTVNLNINIASTNCYNVKLVISIYNTISDTTTVLYDFESISHKYNNNLNLTIGDVIKIYSLAYKAAEQTATVNATCEFTMQPTNVPYNEKLPFNINLGFTNQIDLFKAFTQLFGLTVDVDNDTKVVSAMTMKKVYDNKIIARDWSNKVDAKLIPETTYFIEGYGQENIIKMLDNESDNVTESSSFVSKNEMLEKTKELFTLPFEAGLDNYAGGHFVANIPIEQITDTEITMQGGKPHLVRISGSTISYTIGSTNYNYKIATHIKLSEIFTYYSELSKMLEYAMCFEDYFNLSDKDIQDNSQFIPVFVQKLGCYLYVNKINNYVNGLKTKCQLIKL